MPKIEIIINILATRLPVYKDLQTSPHSVRFYIKQNLLKTNDTSLPYIGRPINPCIYSSPN